MDYKETARQIMQEVGGEGNVNSLTHCMTRLRFTLADESIVDDKRVEDIPGVMGVMKKGGQYQIIIGNNVAKCYKELEDMCTSSTQDRETKKTGKKVNPITAVLDFIAGCMTPIIPAIIAGGLVKVLLVIFGPTLLGWLSTESSTYMILEVIGDAPFYFLPMLLAVTAARKLNCSIYLSVALAGVLLHPEMTTLLNSDTAATFLGLPVTGATYSSSVIPILLSVILLKYVEILVDRITPEWSKNFLKPLLILLITAPVSLIALAPLGNLIGVGLSNVVSIVYNTAPWLAMAIFSGLMPFVVMTGMHYAFIPTALAAFANPGYEMLLVPAMLCSNLAQASASAAVFTKTKDKKMRQVALPASVSAFFAGVTEPALYGVTLRLKTPLIAACIGGAAGGLYCGLVRLAGYSMATPCLTAIVQFIPTVEGVGMGNFYNAVIAAAISIILTFGLTLFLYKNKAQAPLVITVSSPVRGQVLPLEAVKDEAFSSGVLGKGYAVIPSEGQIVSPFNGTVDNVFDTAHAIGLVSDQGMEMLVHIGLETVGLNGKYFKAMVKSGDRVGKGQVLITFDLDKIKEAGYDITTPVLVTNTDMYSEVTVASEKAAGFNKTMLTVVAVK